MKKPVSIIIFTVIITVILCSCVKKDAGYLEFPKTTWGMSVEETLDAYGLAKEKVTILAEGENSTIFAINDGHEIFGEKTSEIRFEFMDIGNGSQALCAVSVSYPEHTDMVPVLKEMRKAYGETLSDLSIHLLFQPLGNKLSARSYKESEHLKLWGRGSVSETIPKAQAEDYAKLWKKFQPGLEEENWESFAQDAKLVVASWSDQGEFVGLEKNELHFYAYNLVIYNEIKGQVSNP